VTIIFLTFLMLFEGRDWLERCYSLFPEEARPRWRGVGHDIYKTVGGYVTGNILISLIAGASITIVLLVLGVPYAVALGLLVAFLDLIPLAGATVAGVIVTAVAFLHTVPAGIIVLVFFIVYQQLENHFLQPVIYGRTVQLSPLAVLISVLVGAELARHPRSARGDSRRRRDPGRSSATSSPPGADRRRFRCRRRPDDTAFAVPKDAPSGGC